MRMIGQPRPLANNSGLSLPEALFSIGLIWLMIVLLTPRSAQIIPLTKLELATSRLAAGLTKAMRKADNDGSCSISLSNEGWGQLEDAGVRWCLDEGQGSIGPGVGLGVTGQLRHNFPTPAVLTINPRGSDPRVSQGGIIVLSMSDTNLQRCLVLEPVLGLLRVGRYAGTTTGDVQLDQCIADQA